MPPTPARMRSRKIKLMDLSVFSLRSISRNKGFTLLEVMMAVVLMVSGFLSLSWAMSVGLFAGGDNENTLIAINLAQEKMEEIRNKSYANALNEAKAAVSGFSSF